MPLSRGTTQQPRKWKRGKSVEFDRGLFLGDRPGLATRLWLRRSSQKQPLMPLPVGFNEIVENLAERRTA
jgi:hypothetical protein